MSHFKSSLLAIIGLSSIFMAAGSRAAAECPQIKQLDRSVTASSVSPGINLKQGGIDLPDEVSKSFSLRFSVPAEALMDMRTLIEIPEFLTVKTKVAHPHDDLHQNYTPFITSDGVCRVLEADIELTDSLTSEIPVRRTMTIGAPVALLDSSMDMHDVIVQFTGVEFSLYVDGMLYDNDFPIGYPVAQSLRSNLGTGIDDAAMFIPALDVTRNNNPTYASPQYWTPPFFNAWVGDVVSCWHNGRYHIFYLFDRRGHKSKFGHGGHYFEHISSPDLIEWTEHEASLPVEHQWECFGTGTPIERDGKLYLNFGFHTTRMYDDSKTTLPVMRQAFDSLGHTVSLNYDTISDRVPAGASFAISSDGGETFTKSHVLSHLCENPSIYADPKDNTLRMLANYGARGTWRSDSLSGGWTCINADFPPGGDCTFPFIVGDYDYIVGGFRGMWGKPGNDDIAAFEDFVAQGKDCYDGLSVPAVTRLPDGRTMMAGWVKMQPWGGALVVHEIVPNGKDGAIGSKWVDEMIPQLPRVTLDKTLTAGGLPSSFICDFTLSPKKMNQGKISVCLSDDTFWTLDLNDDRIWFASTEAERSNTLGEGGDVAAAHDYAIPARLKGMKSIPVRILVKSEPKFCGSIIDIEIARCRTMLSYRPDTNINSIAISTDGMTVK